MTDNTSPEISEEQRQAIREKYGVSTTPPSSPNPSLKTLKTLAYIGIIIGVVLAFISGLASGGAFGLTFIIASFLFSLGFIAMFSYLIADAVITGIKK